MTFLHSYSRVPASYFLTNSGFLVTPKTAVNDNMDQMTQHVVSIFGALSATSLGKNESFPDSDLMGNLLSGFTRAVDMKPKMNDAIPKAPINNPLIRPFL